MPRSRMFGVLLLGLSTLRASAGNYARSYAQNAKAVREAILGDYDKIVPPMSDRLENYSLAGTDVGLQIRFFKVQGVDASSGQMRLKVWVRLTWYDERLRWDPTAYGNVTQVHVSVVAMGEDGHEIWIPDIQLYNANQGSQLTLDPGIGTVDSTGNVFLSRPGLIDTMCKFSGLVAFPFDNLQCAMEWGGWAYSGGYQGIYLFGNPAGYSFSDQEDTAGSSYQEYSIKAVDVDAKTNFYPSSAEEPWTVVKYTITLNRAAFYYWLLIIVPTMILTYTSFGVFFMSHEVGERLSFGITLVLVVEVMKVTVATFVPVCGELLWVDLFMLVNMIFCSASLAETALVLFLAFHSDEHLLPGWLAPWLCCSFFKRTEIGLSGSIVESSAGTLYRRLTRDKPATPRATTFTDSVEIDLMTPKTQIKDLAGTQLSESDTAKLIFFENLFYQMDSDWNGKILQEDVACMLSFVHLGMSRKALTRYLSTKYPEQAWFACNDFMELCIELMWEVPFEEIRMGSANYTSSFTRFEKRCSEYWLQWAKAIDLYCRFWLPLLYTITLGLLLNLDLTDTYLSGAGETMFEGIGPASMTAGGVINFLVTPFIGFFAFLSWIIMRRHVHRGKTQRTGGSDDKEEQAVSVKPVHVKPVVPSSASPAPRERPEPEREEEKVEELVECSVDDASPSQMGPPGIVPSAPAQKSGKEGEVETL